jgi:pyrroloquinoline quinone (PQQ) biosynthesis protein C
MVSAPPVLTEDSVPMLSPHVRLLHRDGSVVLDAPEAEYAYSGHGAALAAAAVPLLNGSASLTSIARGLGAGTGDVIGLLAPPTEGGAVTDIGPLLRTTDTDAYLDAYFAICDSWARDIFVRPFWNRMLGGTAGRNLVLGWGLEFYHRTVGADEHNACSVEYCTRDDVRGWLTEHFAEEYGHGEIFLDGLEACGFERPAVARSAPLPSTRALIDYMADLARTDSIAYLGCYGILHSPRTGQTVERVDAQFDRLIRLYPFAAGILEKIREHAKLDLGLGHDHIVLETLIRRDGVPDRTTTRSIMRAAHGMVTVFCGFFDGILDCYGREEAALPRAPSPD